MAGFKDALKQAVRTLAFRTSIDSLKKQGVDQVRVLGMDRIVGLIEESVHRSLRSRLVGIEREAVAEATKAEFLKLMRSNDELRREKTEVEKLKERAEEEIDQLRRSIAKEQRELERRLQESAAVTVVEREGEDAIVEQKVREVFAVMIQNGETPSPALQARMVEVLLSVLGGERQKLEEARSALRDREIDNLQRRIHKLNDSLESTERRLKEVAAMKSIDEGVASIYRDVQGVDAGDSQRERKKELMSGIFAANLRLQKKDPAS